MRFVPSRPALLALATGMAIAVSAVIASADQVVMRDGNVYTGRVVSQTRREIVIDTSVRGISTRLTLDRRLVQSVVIGDDAPASDDAGTPTAETPATTPTIASKPAAVKETPQPKDTILKRDGVDLILEIPMSGTFGQDIYPLAIYDGLKWAEDHGVTDIVFRMNSPGGEVWAAMEIVEIMDQFAGKFRYHALIEHAISATIWPAFNCHTITMTPGATFGGAVVYHINGTGSAEVDKKMTSIMAAKLAASAEAHGHSSYLCRAMMLSEEAVYAQRRGGEWVLTNEKPAGDYDTIDGPDTVLTLTVDQASKYGIVTAVDDRSLDTFAESEGFGDWDNAGDEGNKLAAKANDKCKDLRNELVGTITSFYREAAARSGRDNLTWYASSVQNMSRQLGRYKILMRRAEDLKMAAITESFEQAIDVNFWETEIETRMKEIRRVKRLSP